MTAAVDLGDKVLGQDGSSSAQPFGVCLPACDNSNPCAQGTECSPLHSLQTRQPLGKSVCIPTVGERGTCANQTTCEAGTVCVRYGQAINTWRCQKECSTASCDAKSRCAQASSGDTRQVCKPERKLGQTCFFGHVCEEGAVCVPSQLDDPARCRPSCSKDKPTCLDPQQECRAITTPTGASRYACLQTAGLREACHNGTVCKDPKHLCVGINSTYAACFQPCQTSEECPKGESCETISESSTVTVCRKQVKPGSYFLNLVQCENGGRPVRFREEQPPFCLEDCTSGSILAPDYCGQLSSRTMQDVVHMSDKSALAVGELGVLVYTQDKGKTWKRLPTSDLTSLTAITQGSQPEERWMVDQQGQLWKQTQTQGTNQAPQKIYSISKKPLYGLVVSSESFVVTGEEGVFYAKDPSGSFKLVLSQPMRRAAVRPFSSGESGALMVAVGDKGAIFRSEDNGATWTQATSNTKATLLSVAWIPNALKTGFQWIAVGKGGILLTSSDKGVSWSTVSTSLSQDWNAVGASDQAIVVVGANGALLRWTTEGWKVAVPPPSPNPPTLWGVSVRGLSSIALGVEGIALYSEDGGATWNQATSKLLQCVNTTTPTQANAGACAYRCDPKQNGSDCPPSLPRCDTITTEGKTLTVCMPESRPTGTVGPASPCSPYDGVSKDKLCQPGLRCELTLQGHVCMRPCDPASPQCPPGKECILDTQRKRHFCGTYVAETAPCSPSTGMFCPAGSLCVTNHYTDSSTCSKVIGKKEKQLCLGEQAGQLYCALGLVCVGSASAPYRRYCTKACNWKDKTGCPTGWECLPNQDAVGVCVQRCQSASDTCEVAGLRCRRSFATSPNLYCL